MLKGAEKGKGERKREHALFCHLIKYALRNGKLLQLSCVVVVDQHNTCTWCVLDQHNTCMYIRVLQSTHNINITPIRMCENHEDQYLNLNTGAKITSSSQWHFILGFTCSNKHELYI